MKTTIQYLRFAIVLLVAAIAAAWGFLKLGMLLADVDYLVSLFTKLNLPFEVFDMFYALSYLAFFGLLVAAIVNGLKAVRSTQKGSERIIAIGIVTVAVAAIPVGVLSYFFI